jgi:hypothetical protein
MSSSVLALLREPTWRYAVTVAHHARFTLVAIPTFTSAAMDVTVERRAAAALAGRFFAVGTAVAGRPPHRSTRAAFPHQMWRATY